MSWLFCTTASSFWRTLCLGVHSIGQGSRCSRNMLALTSWLQIYRLAHPHLIIQDRVLWTLAFTTRTATSKIWGFSTRRTDLIMQTSARAKLGTRWPLPHYGSVTDLLNCEDVRNVIKREDLKKYYVFTGFLHFDIPMKKNMLALWNIKCSSNRIK